MSITITCEFSSSHQAALAAERLRRRGYTVSGNRKKGIDPLLVAYPYGISGGNTPSNSLMAALPPMAGNSIMLHIPPQKEQAMVSVLTDDTQVSDCKRLLEALGGKIL